MRRYQNTHKLVQYISEHGNIQKGNAESCPVFAAQISDTENRKKDHGKKIEIKIFWKYKRIGKLIGCNK